MGGREGGKELCKLSFYSMQIVSSAAAPRVGGLGLWARVQCVNPCAYAADNSNVY